jgi:hypothetical protein
MDDRRDGVSGGLLFRIDRFRVRGYGTGCAMLDVLLTQWRREQ